MRLDAHGVTIDLPHGWSGRVFGRARSLATVHAGDFALDLGETSSFGDRSTTSMPPVASFFALTEYSPGAGLAPGAGLFASPRLPLPLDPAAFHVNRLARPRAGQAGFQHFFTTSGRPFCLYVVIAGTRTHRRPQLAVLDHVLRSLRISRRM